MNNSPAQRLIADIGGTYARFAIVQPGGRLEHVASLPCAAHADFHAAVGAYLGQVPAADVRHAAIAIANPVSGDQVRMTNYHWEFSIEEMRQRLALDTLLVVNDFTALAMALPRLAPHERRQVGAGAPREHSVVGLLGSGSGLGVSGLIPAEGGWISLGSEGGHASFSPRDEREVDILRFAWRRHPHVSFERLLSGPGLELIHRALCEHSGVADQGHKAPDITRLALDGTDAMCREAVDTFCAMLGSAAGNLAVTLGALGGIYIGGGIVPRLGEYFDRSPFRARFEDHGRHSAYLKRIPTYVVTAEQATIVGAAAILAAQLARAGVSAPLALLDQVQRSLTELSPAERRVADLVLRQPRTVLNEPVAQIARVSGVSQPTVIRFCRSLGCDGLSDFKLRLASALSGTMPIVHTQVTGDDSMLELSAKVLNNTASAVLQVRDGLNRDAIDGAIALLLGAQRIEFHAVGHSAVVAQDAQLKFLRFGVSSVAYTDARVQLLAARVLRASDVVVIISSNGRVPELLQVADIAHERGARVVAITTGHSPLARRADVALIVDHVEDPDTQMPMISRILHLLVIDILAVGVAMRRSVESPPADEAVLGLDEDNRADVQSQRERRSREAGGALPLARLAGLAGLTTHSR